MGLTFWDKAKIGGGVAATAVAGGGLTAWYFGDPKGFMDFWGQSVGNLNVAQVSGIAVGGAAFIGLIAVVGYMAYQSWKESQPLTVDSPIKQETPEVKVQHKTLTSETQEKDGYVKLTRESFTNKEYAQPSDPLEKEQRKNRGGGSGSEETDPRVDKQLLEAGIYSQYTSVGFRR